MRSRNRSRACRGSGAYAGVRWGTRTARVAGGSFAALLLAVMLVLPSAATAAKKCHRPKPDLKIVVLRAGFGDPAYAIVGTDGVMEPIEVMVGPSLSTSGETLTIEVSMNLEGENGERQDVGDDQEWSPGFG